MTCAGSLRVLDHRKAADDEKPSQVVVSTLRYFVEALLAALDDCFGTKPMKATKLLPFLTLEASATEATSALAVSGLRQESWRDACSPHLTCATPLADPDRGSGLEAGEASHMPAA